MTDIGKPAALPPSNVSSLTQPRISPSDKRRNRRRKSKYARKVFSVAHAMLGVHVLLVALFVLAVFQGLTQGGDLALRSVEQRPGDLSLPGANAGPRRMGGPLQFAIWLYLFGAPAVFALQRGLMWRATATGAKYLTLTIMAVWFVVILVILVTANLAG